jgi:hypothetical protein
VRIRPSLVAALLLASGAPGAQESSTSSEEPAARRWRELVQLLAPAERTAPFSSFDLNFDVTIHSPDGGFHDASARYRYREPGWVRIDVRQTGTTRLRGPRGDFLLREERSTPLVGRDFAEDRRELDEALSVARAFTGLTQPSALRIEGLRLPGAPPSGLPRALGERAAALEWIAGETADLRRGAGGEQPGVDTVQLGLDRASGLPAVAIVLSREAPGRALLLELSAWVPLDGLRLPSRIRAWHVDPSRRSRFPEEKSADLYLAEGGRLGGAIEEALFAP